jgi:transposase
MAYLGLVPSEDSTGDTIKRGPITKAGNRRYRTLIRKGKLKTVAIVAIARELAGFIWAVARAVTTTRFAAAA